MGKPSWPTGIHDIIYPIILTWFYYSQDSMLYTETTSASQASKCQTGKVFLHHSLYNETLLTESMPGWWGQDTDNFNTSIKVAIKLISPETNKKSIFIANDRFEF